MMHLIEWKTKLFFNFYLKTIVLTRTIAIVQPESIFVTELSPHMCLKGALPKLIAIPFAYIRKVQFAYASSALLAWAKHGCLGCVVVVMQHLTGQFNAFTKFVSNCRAKFFEKRKRGIDVHFDIREGVDQSHTIHRSSGSSSWTQFFAKMKMLVFP